MLSILIPTFNNLEYLKFCIRSLKKNSIYQNQIICHVNIGDDGTLEFLRSINIEFTHTSYNSGICEGINKAAKLANYDYLLYAHDDFYFCPNWDDILRKEVGKIGHNNFYLSGTMMNEGQIKFNCGNTPNEFDEREKFINELISDLPQLKFAQFGLNNFEPIWGSNYYHYLSKTKMALNISRGKYQNKYSSDRISSLIGNGLLVFLNEKTQFQKILKSNEVVYYKNKKDLLKKITFYNLNDRARIKIAKSGYKKYHKFMNNKIISKYIMGCVKLEKIKNPFWHNM